MSFPARWFGGSPGGIYHIGLDHLFFMCLLAAGVLTALAALSFLSRHPWNWVCDRIKLHPQHPLRRRITLFGLMIGLGTGTLVTLFFLARTPHGDPPHPAPPGSWAAGYPTGGLENQPVIRQLLGDFHLEPQDIHQWSNLNGFKGEWAVDLGLKGEKQPGSISIQWERNGWFSPWKIRKATLTIWVPWEYEPGKTTPTDYPIDLITQKPPKDRPVVFKNGKLVPLLGPLD